MSFPYQSQHRKARALFTDLEDNILRQFVIDNGFQNLDRVRDLLPNRTIRQLRERYKNYLDPKIALTPFTPEEDQKLVELFKSLNGSWSKIQIYFPARTDVHLRNRYRALARRESRNAIQPDIRYDESIKRDILLEKPKFYTPEIVSEPPPQDLLPPEVPVRPPEPPKCMTFSEKVKWHQNSLFFLNNSERFSEIEKRTMYPPQDQENLENTFYALKNKMLFNPHQSCMFGPNFTPSSNLYYNDTNDFSGKTEHNLSQLTIIQK